MAQRKICSKLNEVQEAGVKRQGFPKNKAESFCQKLKDVEMTQFLQKDNCYRQDEGCGYRNSYKPRKLKGGWEP